MAQVPYGRMPEMQQSSQQNVAVQLQDQRVVTSPGMEAKEKYKRTLSGLGTVEIVLGVLSCVLAVATLIFNNYTYQFSDFTLLSQGIWCGVFLIVSGILGVKTKSNPSACMYKANMALSIITACAMGVLIILSSFAAVFSDDTGILIIHSLLAFIGLAGMIISIIHSAYCCGGVCCHNNEYQGIMMCMPQQCVGVQQPQQMVQLPNGQYVMVSTQGMAPQGYGYPHAPVPVAGMPAMYQPGPQATFQPASVPYPSTGVSVLQSIQPGKVHENQPHGNMETPPSYSEVPPADF